MGKKVMISVKTVQYIDGEPETLELITQGDYYKEGEEYFAQYDETEISGMEGTKTILKIGQDSLNIIREGTTVSNLYFKRGQNHISLYSTPYGALEVTVNPKKVNIDIDEHGGNVELKYILQARGIESIENELKLNIKEMN